MYAEQARPSWCQHDVKSWWPHEAASNYLALYCHCCWMRFDVRRGDYRAAWGGSKVWG
jgi:hypothetical protein